MKYRDTELGIEDTKRDDLQKIITELESEILFTPGSQNRTTIDVDRLAVLVRAAKDALLLKPIYESIVPVYEELEDIGRTHVAKDMGKAITSYTVLHPDVGRMELI